MHYLKFLNQLFETGRVAIESPDAPNEQSVEEGTAWLADFESQWRGGLAYDAPPFQPEVASWAGRSFYHACQMLVYPLEDSNPGNQKSATNSFPAFNFSASTSPDASAHYNVDLVFRFLPDLRNFVKAYNADGSKDDLWTQISDWCIAWPLSSVGIANLDQKSPVNIDAFNIDAFLTDDCLLQLYVDRIIERFDIRRAQDPRIARSVQESIGENPDLAKRFRTELLKKTTPTNS